jgi:hypothetical protein
LISERFQPAVRFALVDPDGDDNNEQELGLGLGIYPYKHNFKWQTDAMLLGHEGSDTQDTVIRTQLQMAF